ncbi:hypothetical protein STFR1_10142 [Bacillus vallismortis]
MQMSISHISNVSSRRKIYVSKRKILTSNKKDKSGKMPNPCLSAVLLDALGGIRTPDRRGTGNHRSIQLSYERIWTA